MELTRFTYYSANRNNFVWSILIRVIFFAVCGYLLFQISMIANVPDKTKLLQANIISKPLANGSKSNVFVS
jgi:hypothetical protein